MSSPDSTFSSSTARSIPSVSASSNDVILWTTMRAGQILVLGQERLQRVGEQLVRVVLAQVQLPVVGRARRRPASDDDPVPALVENLRDTRRNRAVAPPVEADADEAALKRRVVANQPPRRPSGLVIEGGGEVPGPRRFILELASLERALARWGRRYPAASVAAGPGSAWPRP